MRTKMNRLAQVAGVAVVAAGAGLATAGDVIMFENFNEPGDYQHWHVNGNQMIFPGGADGEYMGVPYKDFMGITLSNVEARSITGDLTHHGAPFTVEVDVSVFQLNNWFGDAMDPSNFPLVLQFIDRSGADEVSVFYAGIVMPQQSDGWTTLTYKVPDPTMTDLPEGWGGTGDEDPNTYEPILPPDRTYRSVMESVDEVRLTTFVPGYFYASNFWEVGFDNVTFRLEAGECIADWNGDGEVDINDFFAYLDDFEAGDPRADLNNDGEIDINDFFTFLSEFEAGC